MYQAEIDIKPIDYGSIIIVLSVFYFIVGSLIAFLVAFRLAPELAIFVSPIAGLIFGFMVFSQLIFYPRIKIKKRVRDIEKNLVFALRTILIEIKSGVSVFDSLKTLAIGNYGEISSEVESAIEKINTGTIEEDALEELGARNPSLFFRRSIWQIVNGLKSGSDLGQVVSTLIESLVGEQKNQIKLYGASLKILSLMYMMLGVIVPALGLTLLIILSTFPQIEIPEIVFWGMLGFLAMGQIMFLGMVKSRRPNLIGE